MKKILTLVFAILAAIFAILAPISVGGSGSADGTTPPTTTTKENPPILLWVFAVVIVLCVAGFVLTQLGKGSKLVALIPVIGLLVLSKYMLAFIDTVISSVGSNLGVTLPGSGTSFETLEFLMLVAFIVAIVFAFKSSPKWAVIIAIVYTVLMLVSQFELVITFLMVLDSVEEIKSFLFLLVAFVFALASQTSLFVSLLGEGKKAQPQSESQQPSAE